MSPGTSPISCRALLLLWLAAPGYVGSPAFAGPVSVQVLDPDGAALPGIVVYVETSDHSLPASRGTAAIDILQKDRGFEPYVSVVQAVTSVTFTNLDDITHHIYSVTGGTRFSYTIRANEKTPALVIDKPGLIAMGCNIHDWMSGYLLVLETPYFALTDERGIAQFDIDQTGAYEVVAWHPQMPEEIAARLEVPGASELALKLQRPMKAIPRQRAVDEFDFLEGY